MLPTIHVSLGVIYKFIDNEPHIFMQIRDEEGPLFGKWEFPGGNIEPGENPKQAIVREIEEEVGITIHLSDCYYFKTYTVSTPKKDIRLYTHVVKTTEALKLETWFPLKGKFSNIPEPNYEMIDNLREFFNTKENFANLEALLWKP